MDRFNKKFPKMTDQAQTSKQVAKRVPDDSSFDQVSARPVHPPSISNSALDSTVPTALIAKTVLLMPNRVAPILTSDRYKDLYFSESDDNQVFEETVDSKNLKLINT